MCLNPLRIRERFRRLFRMVDKSAASLNPLRIRERFRPQSIKPKEIQSVLIPYESGSVSDPVPAVLVGWVYVLIPYESGSVSD